MTRTGLAFLLIYSPSYSVLGFLPRSCVGNGFWMAQAFPSPFTHVPINEARFERAVTNAADGSENDDVIAGRGVCPAKFPDVSFKAVRGWFGFRPTQFQSRLSALFGGERSDEKDPVYRPVNDTESTSQLSNNTQTAVQPIRLEGFHEIPSRASNKIKLQQKQDHSVSGGHHHGNPALHQVEHRSKEKISIKLGEEIAGKWVERVVEIGDRAIERTSEKMLAHSSPEPIVKLGKGLASEMIKTGGEKGTTRVGKRAAEALGERGTIAMSEKGGERLLTKSGGFLDRAIGVPSRIKGVAGELGEKSATRVGERAVEALSIGERGATIAMSEKGGERLLAKSGRFLDRVVGVPSERIWLRVGEAAMITLPVLGGIFGLYLFREDMRRFREEWAHKAIAPTALFLGAGLADFLDSIFHFFIAYGLSKKWSHHRLVVAEEWSLGCAIASTIFAVAGEIVALRKQKQQQKAQEAIDLPAP